jgi:dTDP-4-amino-4,6-dideoxygalactose transaminase
MNIPFNKPDIRQEEIESVVEVLKSGWLIQGKYSAQFEEEFCKFAGCRHAALVSTCTAGLHLSLMAMEVRTGDEIIVPAQTHAATAHVVELLGATPVFVDVDKNTANITAEQISAAITKKTRGIMVVHMSGIACEMDDIMSLAESKGLFVIEDCAHALGTFYKGKHAGNFGISGCFSFYPTKHITTGEGGMAITNNEKIFSEIKITRAFGIDTPPELRAKPGVYDVRKLGNNYRLTDFQAAFGLHQLRRFQTGNLAQRKRIARKYIELLGSCRDEAAFNDFMEDCSYFFFPVYIKNKDRDQIMLFLKEKGVGVTVHYATPVPLMSFYRNKYNLKEGMFPNAEYVARKQISLPMQPTLKDNEIEYVIAMLKEKIYE